MKELKSHSKQKLIYALLCILILGVFLSSSRVPALLNKVSADPFTSISGIGFSANELLPLIDRENPLIRNGKLIVNWISTNFIGMSFGLLFSVAFSLFLQTGLALKKRIPSIAWPLFGSQIGVCVNCASPLIYAFKKNNLNSRFALSVISSSPTLNVIVLFLGFSLLPFPLFSLNLVCVLIYLFLIIPILVPKDGGGNDGLSYDKKEEIKWLEAIYLSLSAYFRELKKTLILFLPIMFFAAIAGIFVFEYLQDVILLKNIYGLGAILIFSFIGVLIPTPLTFDVLLVSILYNAGLSPGVCAALLFTLGIFSPISGLVIGQNYGYKLSLKLGVSVIILGLLSGVAYEYYLELKSFEIKESLKHPIISKRLKFSNLSNTKFEIYKDELRPLNMDYKKVFENYNTKIFESRLSTQVNERDTFKKHRLFFGKNDLRISNNLKIKGALAVLNLDDDDSYEIFAIHDWGIGIYKYLNDTFKKIGKINVPQSEINTFFIPIDINLDGYTDFLTGAEKDKNLIFYINQKDYSFKKVKSNILKGNDNIISYGLFNDDLNIDLAISKTNGDLFFYYGDGNLEFNQYKVPMNKIGDGLTHSILISDLDSDHSNDVIVGNDLQNPDRFFVQKDSGFRENRNFLKENPVNTMSVITADFNNDGLEDLFFTDMIYKDNKRFFFQDDKCGGLKGEPKYYCYAFYDLKKTIKDYDLNGCQKMNNNEMKKTCLENMAINLALHKKDKRWKGISVSETLRSTLDTVFKSSKRPFPKQVWKNVLFLQNKDGFQEVAERFGVDKTDWSWSTVAADFNNDSYTDLFVTNGSNYHYYETQNLLFFNKAGKRFIQDNKFINSSKENTFHSVALDIDNDGDLDILESGSLQHLTAHINTFGSESAIFKIIFKNKKNLPNIKCLFEVKGKKVLKEVNMTGSYMSFNSKDCHMGLGDANRGVLLEVRIGNKITRKLNFSFEKGKTYKVFMN